jgi:hypothetical protein
MINSTSHTSTYFFYILLPHFLLLDTKLGGCEGQDDKTGTKQKKSERASDQTWQNFQQQ